MPSSTDSKPADRSALRSAYHQLTETQKSIVQIFALLYEPTNRAQAYDCWSQGFEDFPEEAAGHIKALTTNQFSQEVSKLIRQGLLTQLKQQGPRCQPQVLEIAIREAVLADTFEPMAAAVEAEFPVFTYFQSNTRQFRSREEFLRSLRIAIYREDSPAIDALFADIARLYWRDEY